MGEASFRTKGDNPGKDQSPPTTLKSPTRAAVDKRTPRRTAHVPSREACRGNAAPA